MSNTPRFELVINVIVVFEQPMIDLSIRIASGIDTMEYKKGTPLMGLGGNMGPYDM